MDEDIEILILDFFSQSKYLAFCSNAPIILAKILGKQNPDRPGSLLTFGGEENIDLKAVAEKLGNEVMTSPYTYVTYDEINKIVTVPGNSTGKRRPAQVFASIQAMVQQVYNQLKGITESPTTLSVISRYEIKKGKKEEFEDAMFDYSYLTRQEEGCIRFDVLEDD